MRNTVISSDLFPSEYKSSVNENDPCRTSVPDDQIPDPTPFPVLEDDKEVIVSESNYSAPSTPETTEEHECCVSMKTGNCGCIHFTTDEDETAEVKFQKSPRQKFVDKVKNKIASVSVYGRRINFASKFSPKKPKKEREAVILDPSVVQPWMPADAKCREKKISHNNKRRHQSAVAKIKMIGS